MPKCPHCQNNIDIHFVKAPANSQSDSSSSGNIGDLLALVHDDELETDFEIDFIKQTRERFEQYGERTRMSDKQMACLRKIAAK